VAHRLARRVLKEKMDMVYARCSRSCAGRIRGGQRRVHADKVLTGTGGTNGQVGDEKELVSTGSEGSNKCRRLRGRGRR
jgi:hypothetical protein